MTGLLTFNAAGVLARLLRGDIAGQPHKIGAMYIEFENNAGASVTVPSPTRDEGLLYYAGLSSHATRDYLRVPILATSSINDNNTSYDFANRAVFFAHTAGTTGAHGKAFSAVQQSRIYGAALVVTPDYTDAAQDIIFMRGYYDNPSEQLIKASAAQVGIKVEVPFT